MGIILTHEKLFRSEKVIEKRSKYRLCVIGLGALGSNLIVSLIRHGFQDIVGIDYDRIDRHNPANQYYTNLDVGRKKSAALQNKIYREFGISIKIIDNKIQNLDPKIFSQFDCIVDTLDNWESREYLQDTCRKLKIDYMLIHAGMSDNGFSEIKWDKSYKIPEVEQKQEDVCDYPLACSLVYFTFSILTECIVRFVDSGKRFNSYFTLNDLKISMLEI